MSAEHTPRPWRVELDVTDDGNIDIWAGEWEPIAIVHVRESPDDIDDPPREVALANGRLIAAAPRLLAALQRAALLLSSDGHDEHRECGCPEGAILADARAAIAEALGEESASGTPGDSVVVCERPRVKK